MTTVKKFTAEVLGLKGSVNNQQFRLMQKEVAHTHTHTHTHAHMHTHTHTHAHTCTRTHTHSLTPKTFSKGIFYEGTNFIKHFFFVIDE